MCMMSTSCPLSHQLPLFSVLSISFPQRVNQCPFVTVKSFKLVLETIRVHTIYSLEKEGPYIGGALYFN